MIQEKKCNSITRSPRGWKSTPSTRPPRGWKSTPSTRLPRGWKSTPSTRLPHERKSNPLTRFIRDQEGSAVIEFVVLALPLLLPLTVYLNEVHQNSIINSDLHTLARQSARAFITSGDESFEAARMQTLLTLFESKILKPAGISETPVLDIECSATPCLTPDSQVKVTAALTHLHKNFSGIFRFISAPSVQFSASDTQIVDAWR